VLPCVGGAHLGGVVHRRARDVALGALWAGRAEVGNDCLQSLWDPSQQDVGGLQVAVHEAPCVHVAQAPDQMAQELQHPADIQRWARLAPCRLAEAVQVARPEQRHHEGYCRAFTLRPIDDQPIMHGHQVGVNAQLFAHQPLVCH
jgi:hypothetical protein